MVAPGLHDLMTISRTLSLLLLSGGLALGWSAYAGSEEPRSAADLVGLSDALGDLAEQVKDATVFLEVTQGATGRGLGTGFVVDAVAGLVVTNAHVMRDSASATVRFADGREVIGQVLGVDRSTDLAVLDIPPGAARKQLQWGDSDRVRPGNLVMAVGSPLGLQGTTSLGVVSALGRELDLVADSYQDFLQFDAFIDRGSSGGPLVDMQGRVIGINTAIGGDGRGAAHEDPPWRGISYAVPSALARRFVEDLAEYGKVRRGWIGVTCEGLTADRARLLGLERPYGAEIKALVADGPAMVAGLRKGDVILAIEGREVSSAAQVKARVAASPPGTEVRVKVLSQRAIRTVRVTLGELVDDES